MPRKSESFADIFIKLPWWVSAFLGVFLFGALRIFANAGISPATPLTAIFQQLARYGAVAVLFCFTGLTLASAFYGLKRRQLVSETRDLETLRSLPWKDFEHLVAEVFKRRGYQTNVDLGRGPDGGVDVILRHNGNTIPVQCKRWKKSVGVPVVRELLGAMTAFGASNGIVVATSSFTREAQSFAAENGIEVIDGSAFLDLTKAVRRDSTLAPRKPVVRSNVVSSPPTCPSCGAPMVERTARRGPNAGQKFLGCSTYPKCRGTRDYRQTNVIQNTSKVRLR
jgi:restriction system protein